MLISHRSQASKIPIFAKTQRSSLPSYDSCSGYERELAETPKQKSLKPWLYLASPFKSCLSNCFPISKNIDFDEKNNNAAYDYKTSNCMPIYTSQPLPNNIQSAQGKIYYKNADSDLTSLPLEVEIEMLTCKRRMDDVIKNKRLTDNQVYEGICSVLSEVQHVCVVLPDNHHDDPGYARRRIALAAIGKTENIKSMKLCADVFFRDDYIDYEEVPLLLGMLRKIFENNKELNSIDLSLQCNVLDENHGSHVSELKDMLRGKKIASLNLSGNIGGDNLKVIWTYLEAMEISTLCVDQWTANGNILASEIELLAKTLPKTNNLHKLLIRNASGITFENANALIEQLPYTSIQELDLRGNPMKYMDRLTLSNKYVKNKNNEMVILNM